MNFMIIAEMKILDTIKYVIVSIISAIYEHNWFTTLNQEQQKQPFSVHLNV